MNNYYDEMECPLCGADMTEEEGLLWCDACGINENSQTYLEALENQWCEECPPNYPLHTVRECPWRF